MSRYPIYIINLREDRSRLDYLMEQVGRINELIPIVVDAINGRKLPENVRRVLSQDANWANYAGTIGCFLSHVKAWETFFQGGHEWGFIVEDDIDINTENFHAMFKLDIPESVDIVFLNDRMCVCGPGDDGLSLKPILPALLNLDKLKGGSGGDGYFLNRRGALALLNSCLKDFYFGHVDGRLLRYSTSPEDLAALSDGSWIANVISKHHHHDRIPKTGVLSARTLSRPLVKHRGIPSSREAADNVITPIGAGTGETNLSEAECGGVSIRYWNRIANIGDSINPFIAESVSGLRPVYQNDDNRPHVLGIGSIFFMANTNSYIWGSGILDPRASLDLIDASKICAVRGRLTLAALEKAGKVVKDIAFGDPGVFANRVPEVARAINAAIPKRKVALLPHYTMSRHETIIDLARRLDADILSMRSDTFAIFSELASSEIIVSQSLHGLIFAEMLGKPSVWISHSLDEIWTFKFHDWFTNTREPPIKPFEIGETAETILRSARITGLNLDLNQLASSFPRFDDVKCKVRHYPFREARDRNPIICSVNKGWVPVKVDYDLGLESIDSDGLRTRLNAVARQFDESPKVVVAFDLTALSDFSFGDAAAVMELFTLYPSRHFFALLNRGVVSGLNVSSVASTELYDIYDWSDEAIGKGLVCARHPVNFSYSAPGYIIVVKGGEHAI